MIYRNVEYFEVVSFSLLHSYATHYIKMKYVGKPALDEEPRWKILRSKRNKIAYKSLLTAKEKSYTDTLMQTRV